MVEKHTGRCNTYSTHTLPFQFHFLTSTAVAVCVCVRVRARSHGPKAEDVPSREAWPILDNFMRAYPWKTTCSPHPRVYFHPRSRGCSRS